MFGRYYIIFILYISGSCVSDRTKNLKFLKILSLNLTQLPWVVVKWLLIYYNVGSGGFTGGVVMRSVPPPLRHQCDLINKLNIFSFISILS